MNGRVRERRYLHTIGSSASMRRSNHNCDGRRLLFKAMVIIDEMLNNVQCDKETLQRGKIDKNTINLSKYSVCMQ